MTFPQTPARRGSALPERQSERQRVGIRLAPGQAGRCRLSPCRAKPATEIKFIDQAIAAGAVAVVTDSATEKPRAGVAWAQVPHGRRALARLSANFYRRPPSVSPSPASPAPTGRARPRFCSNRSWPPPAARALLIGTIEYHVAGKVLPAPHTTPEALELNRILAEALGQGATEAVMEVSSHALAQQRVYGIPFDVAVFTNLTRDHLDYHHTMEEYFASKQILVRRLRHRTAARRRAQYRRRIRRRSWSRSARSAVPKS